MSKHLLPTAALLGLVSANANAATLPLATTVTASTANPSPAGSSGLGPFGAVGGIGGPISFIAPSAGILTMTVADEPFSLVGDVFEAFVNGVSLGFTSAVPLFGPTPSSGTFTVAVPAGANTFDVNDQLLSYIGFPGPYGGGTVGASFSPAGLTVALSEEVPSAVPEPASLGLGGSWLLGLGLIWRRRRDR